MNNGICIENLPKELDVSKLCRIFQKHGRILSASIDVDERLNSLGKGYISFDNPSSALSAAKYLNHSLVCGNVITVMISKFDPWRKILNNLYTKIFIKNIDPVWDDCDLSREFIRFGEICEASLSVLEDGKSNGYGFIEFKEHSCAKAAVEAQHKSLIVQPFIPRELRNMKPISVDSAKDLLEQSIQFNNLHIKNIPKDMGENELEGLFRKFGQITSVKIARDTASKSKGFGFVCFHSKDDAKKARMHMNGYSLNSKVLEVNFNQKKEARQHYLTLKNFDSNNQRLSLNDEKSYRKTNISTRDASENQRSKKHASKSEIKESSERYATEKKMSGKKKPYVEEEDLLHSFSSMKFE